MNEHAAGLAVAAACPRHAGERRRRASESRSWPPPRSDRGLSAEITPPRPTGLAAPAVAVRHGGLGAAKTRLEVRRGRPMAAIGMVIAAAAARAARQRHWVAQSVVAGTVRLAVRAGQGAAKGAAQGGKSSRAGGKSPEEAA